MKSTYNYDKLDDSLNFSSINELKFCLDCHSEIEFIWKGKAYAITHPDGTINIGEAHYLKDGKAYNILIDEPYDVNSIMQFHSSDAAMKCIIGDDKLIDITTKIKVIDRTI